MGFGAPDRTYEDVVTEEPVLVLVKPTVVVFSRAYYWLENPNGWYCMDNSAAVAGKLVVNLGCGANVADSTGSFSVLGKSDRGGGVTVAGRFIVNRLCDEKEQAPEAVPEPEPSDPEATVSAVDPTQEWMGEVMQSVTSRLVVPDPAIEGLRARVQFQVDAATGAISEPRIVSPSGNEAFDAAALQAVSSLEAVTPPPPGVDVSEGIRVDFTPP